MLFAMQALTPRASAASISSGAVETESITILGAGAQHSRQVVAVATDGKHHDSRALEDVMHPRDRLDLARHVEIEQEISGMSLVAA